MASRIDLFADSSVMLDVNVHPMKLELRIENEPLLLEFIAKFYVVHCLSNQACQR